MRECPDCGRRVSLVISGTLANLSVKEGIGIDSHVDYCEVEFNHGLGARVVVHIADPLDEERAAAGEAPRE